jgi:hypothetical protein
MPHCRRPPTPVNSAAGAGNPNFGLEALWKRNQELGVPIAMFYDCLTIKNRIATRRFPAILRKWQCMLLGCRLDAD